MSGNPELVNFAILLAFVRSLSGEQVVEHVRKGLERREFPADKPVQDVMADRRWPESRGPQALDAKNRPGRNRGQRATIGGHFI